MTIPLPEPPPFGPDACPDWHELADLLARYPHLGGRARRRLLSLTEGLSSEARSALRRDPVRAAKLSRFETEHALRPMSALPGAALAILAAAVFLLLVAPRLSP